MDVVNPGPLNNSSRSAESSQNDHKVVSDKIDDQESVVKSVEKENEWKVKNNESVEDSLGETTLKKENKGAFRKETTLEGDFTDVDKSSVNFVQECNRATSAETSRERPKKLRNDESQVNKSFEEASTENEECFPKELSSESLGDSSDSIDFEQSAEPGYPDSKKHYLSISDIQDFIDSRVAEARLEVVENKIDRVLMKIENIKDDHQKQLFQVLLDRIKELEDKLDKKSVAPKKGNGRRLSELPVEQFSSYIVEKATQTPSEEHDCEGVYVLVSKKNKQQVRQVHRQVAYVVPGGNTAGSNSEEPQPKHPQTKVAKKVIKRVGYPEYLYEESLHGHKGCYPDWEKFERKTVAFLPPIPGPYARRRPRNATYQQNTDFNCSKYH